MDESTITTYNKLAKVYDDETITFWEEFPRTFLDQFIALSGRTVLDVGSGPGRDGLLLKDAGKDMTCIDASDEMVRLSAERGLTSVLGNFESLPFDDLSFDAVWSYTALLHIPKSSLPAALCEIARVLKNGGMFALGMIEGDTEEYRNNMDEGMPRLFSYYQKEELENIVCAQGFELVYFETFKPNSRNYLNFLFKKK